MFCARFRGPLTPLAYTLAIGIGVVAQSTIEPTNSAPNPFQTIEGWAKLPVDRSWGSTSAVDIDKDGRSIWVGERCGATAVGTRRRGRCRRSTSC